MTTIRERLAARVRLGGAPVLDAEEIADVAALLNEVGQHEAAAMQRIRDRATDAATIHAKAIEAEEYHALLIKERRGLWDGFASAALAGGHSPNDAAALADSMIELRKERNK